MSRTYFLLPSPILGIIRYQLKRLSIPVLFLIRDGVQLGRQFLEIYIHHDSLLYYYSYQYVYGSNTQLWIPIHIRVGYLMAVSLLGK